MSIHIDNSLELIRPILEAIDAKVQETCDVKKSSLPTTKLAKELAPEFGTEWIKIYSIISFYVESRPDMEVGLGPNGGIRYKKAISC
jgi:hypothetical protein